MPGGYAHLGGSERQGLRDLPIELLPMVKQLAMGRVDRSRLKQALVDGMMRATRAMNGGGKQELLG